MRNLLRGLRCNALLGDATNLIFARPSCPSPFITASLTAFLFQYTSPPPLPHSYSVPRLARASSRPGSPPLLLCRWLDKPRWPPSSPRRLLTAIVLAAVKALKPRCALVPEIGS